MLEVFVLSNMEHIFLFHCSFKKESPFICDVFFVKTLSDVMNRFVAMSLEAERI